MTVGFAHPARLRNLALRRVRAGELGSVVGPSLGVSGALVNEWSRKAGIKIDRSEAIRKTWAAGRRSRNSSLDKEIFIRPLTPASAWLLGVIVGDGCIKRCRGKIIGLQLCGDLDVCEKARVLLGSQAKVRHLKGGCCGIEIGSRSLAESLIAIGIGPAKTYSVPWPRVVGPAVESHFMRGFWDADGCVTSGVSYGKRRPILTAVSCSRLLMEQVDKRVRRVTRSQGRLHVVDRPNRALKYMSTVNCDKAILLGEWLWAHSSDAIRGNRKYQAFCLWQERWGSQTVKAA